MKYKADRAWAVINLDNIASNVREIRRITNRRTDIMAIVKADAYGHGVMETVRTILDNGISRLGVSMLDEAIQLRKAGIEVPILVLGYTDPLRAEEIVSYGITQTIFSNELAKALSDAGAALNKNVKVHVKIDTGMTRLGYVTGFSTIKEVAELGRLPRLIIEGLYTHFATADESNSKYMDLQFEKFISIWHELNRVGLYIPIKHCANSAAILKYPHTHLDIVRAGIALYGLYPWGSSADGMSAESVEDVNTAHTGVNVDVDTGKNKGADAGEGINSAIKLKPAMELKCNIAMIKEVEAGVPVSYGGNFVTERMSRIATIPIGYADGYTRLLSNRARVLVGGEYAPVIGNICMDQCMIDLTDLGSDIRTGDIVVVMGRQGEHNVTAEEIASICGTINYEVVSLIGRRIPRVYIKDGKVINIVKYLL